MHKLQRTISLLLVMIMLIMTIEPLTVWADNLSGSHSVTIEPFEFDRTYGDFANHIDILSSVNGSEATGSTFSAKAHDTVQIRSRVKSELFPCNVTGMTLTYVKGGSTVSEQLEVDRADRVRNVLAEFEMPDSDVSISFTVEQVYFVRINRTENGQVTSDYDRAIQGDRVHLNIEPDDPEEYTYTAYVFDELGHLAALDEANDFIMPGGSSDVHVDVAFSRIPDPEGLVCKYIDRRWEGEPLTGQVVQEQKSLTVSDNVVNMPDLSGDNLVGGTWYYVSADQVIDSRLHVVRGSDGSNIVNLILGDDMTLSCLRGIEVPSGMMLNIFEQKRGTGRLIAVHQGYSHQTDEAVIGGAENQDGGVINIFGGVITADTNSRTIGAAIGGSLNNTVQRISVFGGTITANQLVGFSAAIGGSAEKDAAHEGVFIYGGEIEAYASGGAGIGGGEKCPGTEGTVNIYGGNISATGHGQSAGIGGGKEGKNSPINIYGGTINAIGKGDSRCGAGIGSGANANGTGDINIYGGNVISRSRQGAGIGGGSGTNSGNIHVYGGNVGGGSVEGGAGIGGGYGASNGTMIVDSGFVVASSSLYDSDSYDITRAMLDLYSYNKDLDSEHHTDGRLVDGIKWLINALEDTETCGAGIGGGHGGDGGFIEINGGKVAALTPSSQAHAMGKGKRGSDGGMLTGYLNAMVTAGSNVNDPVIQQTLDRERACRNNKYAVIEPCAHKDAVYLCNDDKTHTLCCGYCYDNKTEDHTYDEDGLKCTKCSYERVKISFDAGEGSGTMADAYVTKGEYYTLPPCGFTLPQGKTFNGWYGTIGDQNVTFPAGMSFEANENVVFTAQYADPYHLWVGGVQVTEDNKNDILGDGKVTYDPETCTLNFDRYSADMPGVYSNTLIYSEGINLTITGSAILNREAGFANGINVRNGSVMIDGDITLTEASFNAITAERDVILNSGTITVKGKLYGIRADKALYIRKGITLVTADAEQHYSFYYQNIDVDPSLLILEISAERRILSYGNARHIVIGPGAVVTFDLNGGMINGSTDDIHRTIRKNTTVERPEDPTRESDGDVAYTFGGWYTDRALTQAFDFTQPISEDITLYARWTRTFSVEMKWKKGSDEEILPNEVKVVLQKRQNGAWTTVETVRLNANNEWKADFAPVPAAGREDERNYRIRQLNKDDQVILDKNDDDGSDRPTVILNVGGAEKGYLAYYTVSSGKTTITNSSTKEYKVNKTWDADIETATGKQDRPDELQVVLQKKEHWFSWKAVEILTLNRENDWSGEFRPVEAGYVNAVGTYVEYEYRVRELEAEKRDEDGNLPEYENEEERLAAADNRVVYDKWDFDKSYWKEAIKKIKNPNEWIHFEPTQDWVVEHLRDITIPLPEVNFEVDEYTDFYGVHVDSHTTLYSVKYSENSDTYTMAITNTAMLKFDVHSWWINFKSADETEDGKDEKPESCYVMLESKVKKEYIEHLGEEAETANIYTPVFSTIAGDYTLDKLPGTADLKDGIKSGIKKVMGDGFIGKIGSVALDEFIKEKLGKYIKTGVAVAKQTGKGENPLNKWNSKFNVKKYGMGELKVPMDYAGAELVTGLIEMVLDAAIKYFGIPNVHVPVMYQPIDKYWSVKGYAFNTFNKNTFMCNIINTKFHGDDNHLGTVVSGMKYWKNDKEEDRPDSIKINVYYNKDGTKTKVTGSPVELKKSDHSGEDSWAWSLEIPPGDDAASVDKDSFTVEEESVPSGYESSVSGKDITNTKKSTDPTQKPTSPSSDPTEPASDYGKLKIAATRPDSAKDKEQSFVYNITGPNNTKLSVAIVLEKGRTSGSVTIAKLPKGQYSVTEERAWSWRYSDAGNRSATVDAGTAQVAFDHSLDRSDWLSGCSHRKTN